MQGAAQCAQTTVHLASGFKVFGDFLGIVGGKSDGAAKQFVMR
jgi:hypothetical protein